MTTTIDIGTLITRSPDIRNGIPIVVGTGLTVRRIVIWYKLGLTPEEILNRIGYPTLTLAQIYAALTYYHANREEIETLIEKIQSLGTVNTIDISIPLNLACQILPPKPWEPKRLEEILEIKLPESVQQLWNKTSGLRLFEDTAYGQWGLVVWSPDRTIVEQEKKISQRAEDFLPSDLILGEFLGDSELLVLRCNEQTLDFGEVMIALPLDERQEWYKAASSLEEFLSNFIAAKGEKFW